MAGYAPKGSTPFHARIVNGKKHKEVAIKKQHRRIKFLDPVIMAKGLFMILVHDHNTSSRMELNTGLVNKSRWPKIKKRFGL